MDADVSQDDRERSIVRSVLRRTFGLGGFAAVFSLLVLAAWLLDYTLPPSARLALPGLAFLMLAASVIAAPVALLLLKSRKERGRIMKSCLIVAGFVIATQLPNWAVQQFGLDVEDSGLFSLEFALPIATGVIATALIAASLYRLCKSNTRVRGVQLMCYAATLVLTLCASLAIGSTLRARAIDRIASNAEPIIHAIERFTADNHRNPRRLGELVPTYLTAIPPTGHDRYPEFEFIPSDYSTGVAWTLFVRTPHMFTFHKFCFRPTGDYTDGDYEIRGAWAVRHDD